MSQQPISAQSAGVQSVGHEAVQQEVALLAVLLLTAGRLPAKASMATRAKVLIAFIRFNFLCPNIHFSGSSIVTAYTPNKLHRILGSFPSLLPHLHKGHNTPHHQFAGAKPFRVIH